MAPLARILIIGGLLMAWLGRLPGDIHIEGKT
ncbi:MAG: DUF2905 family protein [Candidatus Sumerlaeaceae bacterium]